MLPDHLTCVSQDWKREKGTAAAQRLEETPLIPFFFFCGPAWALLCTRSICGSSWGWDAAGEQTPVQAQHGKISLAELSTLKRSASGRHGAWDGTCLAAFASVWDGS